MKSWIHEIAESYVSGHKPVRRDIKENYVYLTEEQRFDLLSENVLNYIDEQLQNAFGFGVSDLTEEHLDTLLEAIKDMATGGTLGADNTGKELSPAKKAARVKGVSKLVGVVRSGGEGAEKAGRMLASLGLAGKSVFRKDDEGDRSLNPKVSGVHPDRLTDFQSRSREYDQERGTGNATVTQTDVGTTEKPKAIGSIFKAGEPYRDVQFQNQHARARVIGDRRKAVRTGRSARLQGPEL